MIYTNNDILPDGTLDFWAEFDYNYTWQDMITCASCPDRNICEFSYDPYNIDGDCIMMK